MTDLTNTALSFGDFELDLDRRLLLRDGEVVPLKGKAFDLLRTMVERRGEVLSKNDLLDKVWENQFVEENNLTVHVAALRKALGEKKNENRYIVTVPGKGYQFVAPVHDPVTEVIVEHRSLSRIIVEEETNEIDIEQSSLHAFARDQWSYKRFAGVVAVLVMVVAAGGWIYSSRGRYNANSAAVTSPEFSARVFAAAGGVPDRVAISPDGKTIAFVERRQGQYALKLGELEGNNSVEIVPLADRLYRFIEFSPDGRSIYFTARDANHFEPALMRVSILGGAIKDLIPNVNSSFTLSPDARSVAYFKADAENGGAILFTADTATGKDERELLVLTGADDNMGLGVSWSPDGKAIAFAAQTEDGNRLMLVSPNDKSVQPLGDPVQNRIVNVAWLRDGSGLVSIRNTEPHPNDGQVWFVAYPSGEAKLITDETQTYSFGSLSVSAANQLAILQTRSDPQIGVAEGDDFLQKTSVLNGSRVRGEGMNGVCIAPDGKILFTAVINDSRTIWEMNSDGSGQRQLTAVQKDSDDEQISVTPDNRYLVFHSNRSGASEVWRANRDGSDARPITSGGDNIQPAISPDGLSIVYVSARDGNRALRRIGIDGGETAVITTEKSSWPDVSPDGRLIAYSYGRSSRYPSTEIRVIPFAGGAAVHTFAVPLASVLYNRLRWSPDGKSIIYKDHTQGLWKQDLSKDKPQEFAAPNDLRVYHFAFGSDGKLVFSGGSQMREIVVLERSN